MDIYDIVMAPIEKFILGNIRAELMAHAEKSVLEIGVGTGANFKYYDFGKITDLTCLDVEFPDNMERENPKVTFIKGSVEKMPFDPQSFDCIVATLILCTVDIEKSLLEITRTLKHGGLFIFIEHVRPKGEVAAKIADTVNPFWQKIAGGCNLNRQTDRILENSGFKNITINEKGVFRYGIAEKL